MAGPGHGAAEAPKVTFFKNFQLETHLETGQQRVVTFAPDPGTNQPVRLDEGPWGGPSIFLRVGFRWSSSGMRVPSQLRDWPSLSTRSP